MRIHKRLIDLDASDRALRQLAAGTEHDPLARRRDDRGHGR